MGVSKNRGKTPPKWMVKIMVPNPMNKWMILGGKNHILGNIHKLHKLHSSDLKVQNAEIEFDNNFNMYYLTDTNINIYIYVVTYYIYTFVYVFYMCTWYINMFEKRVKHTSIVLCDSFLTAVKDLAATAAAVATVSWLVMQSVKDRWVRLEL